MSKIIISRALLAEKNLNEILRFAFYSDTTNFVKVFNEVGIQILPNDDIEQQLEYLAYLGNIGADLGGKVRRPAPSSEPIHFSVWNTIGKMNINYNDLEKSGIEIVN